MAGANGAASPDPPAIAGAAPRRLRRDYPHDFDSEQAVLAALFVQAGAFATVRDLLTSTDFYSLEHQRIWQAACELSEDGVELDPIVVSKWLEAHGYLGTDVRAETPLALARGAGAAGNLAHFACVVRTNSNLRTVRLAAEAVLERVSDPTQGSAADLLRYARGSLAVAIERCDAGAANDADDRAVDQLQALGVGRMLAEAESRLEQGVQHIQTGWQRLDAAIGGGFAIPSLNVLGAAPKTGKSTWAQIVATRHVEAGGVAYYLDLENGRLRFLRRLLCRRAQIASLEAARALRDHRVGVFTSRDAVVRWEAAKTWVRETLGRGLFVEFQPPEKFAARLRAAREVAGDRKLLVVLDSLQKLPMTDLKDRRAGIDAWLRELERLRTELDVAILAISEIATDPRTRRHAGGETAFKESGSIAYSADLAMTMVRAHSDDEDADSPATLRVELARDADEDPRGPVASYRAVRPHHDLEEVDPVAAPAQRKTGPVPVKADRAREFLANVLAGGAIDAKQVKERAKAADIAETTLQDVANRMGIVKEGGKWTLPDP
jgi:replicative DNA helicase